MIHYVFNNNKPLTAGKDEHVYILHYCEKCNTELVGEWREKSLKNEKAIELAEFAKIKKCPICNSKFSTNSEYHVSNYQIVIYGNMRGDVVKSGLMRARGAIDDVRHIPSQKCISVNDLPKENFALPEIGSEILTRDGVGIVSTISFSGDEIKVKYHDDTLESIMAYLGSFRKNWRTVHSEEKWNTFETKYSLANLNTPEKNIRISDKEKLKEYLKNILDIEKNVFSISERLKELYFLDCDAEKDSFASEKLLLLKDKNNVDKSYEKYKALKSKKIEKDVTIDDFPIDYPEEPQKPKKPKAPILAKPGFFNKKRVLAENALLTEKYEKALEKYNLANEKYKADIKKRKEIIALLETQRENEYKLAIENAKETLAKEIVEAEEKYEDLLKKYKEVEITVKDRPTPEKAKHYLIKDEIKIAEELLKKFYKARNKMYSYGVLFEKYRNFVAVSSFYEYLASGRCETLEGPNGAYNLFENEIRMNMVICQLNQVLESLEEIKQNQYMIYSAIQESNRLLNSLNSSTSRVISVLGEIKFKAASMESYMSKIADNTEVIAYNTERTAFYAKKNTELTNALGFLVALK